MKFFMDFATGSLNEYGEELCGDKVEFLNEQESFIAVLSDGLRSGVKANILATLTAKIAITMLKEGLSIEEVVDTIIHTLPICSVRKLAYSTFTIVKVDELGMVYIAEFDNPGDDTTVVTLQAIKPKEAILFSGPPKDRNNDEVVIKALMGSKGKKIICGGTAANIAARVLGREIRTCIEMIDRNIPPIGYMEGIDLVTEGVLTIGAATQKLERIKNSNDLQILYNEDGASKLARILFEDCTHIKFLVGQAINPAHQNPDFPDTLSIKLNVLKKLQEILISLGKIVTIAYY